MSSTKELLQQRFKELTGQRESILAKSLPLREERDELAKQVQALKADMNEIAVKIKEAETGLFEIDNERGQINKALGGKTGK